eukprot:1161727-Pelagomonas_calceolata.AAC.1
MKSLGTRFALQQRTLKLTARSLGVSFQCTGGGELAAAWSKCLSFPLICVLYHQFKGYKG